MTNLGKLIIVAVLLATAQSCRHPENKENKSDYMNAAHSNISVEDAREALIEMMRESDNEKWGGMRKRYTPQDPFDLLDEKKIEIQYVEKPKPIPDIMNLVEFFDNGEIKIGFWHCDLKNKTFFCAYQNDRSYIEFIGEFYFDSKKWRAKYQIGSSGTKIIQ